MRDCDNLRISLNPFCPHNIGIELPVLAQASALRALVAEDVGDGVPAGGERNIAVFCGHHAGEGGCHFRAERYLAAAAVGEGVGLLIHDLVRCLSAIQLCMFQNARAVFLVAKKIAHALHVFGEVAEDKLVYRIKKGVFVIECTGERIPTKEANESDSRYLFEVDKNWTVDGPVPANLAGYVNHSCEPNTEAQIEDGRIFYYATCDIKSGEELTIDYGEEYFKEFIEPVGCRCDSCLRG